MVNGFTTKNKASEEINVLPSNVAGNLTLDNTLISQQSLSKSPVDFAIKIGNKQSLSQRLSNISISQKVLMSLLVCGIVPVVGIGTVLTSQNSENQAQKAKSELAVTEVHNQNLLHQIALGFRSQADNSALIQAASLYTIGEKIPYVLQSELKDVLQNEMRSRKIEYATLVGSDLKIIESANANRKGETFNPKNLIREVFITGKQIQSHTLVNWSEIERESPPLPLGFKPENALIRYTVTPVKSRVAKKIIAVFVAGEIITTKKSFIGGNTQHQGDGYSAVYYQKEPGEFSLATASKQNGQLDLPDKAILKAAINSPGKVFTQDMNIGGKAYTVAARTIPNITITEQNNSVEKFDSKPIAILVEGTSRVSLNNLLLQIWNAQLLYGTVGLILVALSWLIFRQSVVQPLERIKQKVEKFTLGDSTSRAIVSSNDEVGQLAVSFNMMADRVTSQINSQEEEVKVAQLINKITVRVRESLNPQQILRAAVTNTRQAIKADRVIVYHFDENWHGKVIAESVDADCPEVLGANIYDPCFAHDYVHKYQEGRVTATENIYKANLNQCHINLLEQYSVKANLVAPILLNNKLYGLLIAHQCYHPRKWQQSEIDLMKAVAVPVGLALEQAQLLEKVESARQSAEVFSAEQYQLKKSLQEQVLELLSQIKNASNGDLTVQAKVIPGDIGTVAECCNSIIGSLRGIVTKVKQSVNHVNLAVGDNKDAIHELALEALEQAEAINRTLNSVEQMGFDIQTVAQQAQSAAQVAHTAVHTVAHSSEAMDMTVNNILTLRDTVSETAKKVKRLGKSSQQISQITSIINQIALQTNVLAVNAGLEAGRTAGEGEGFVVIAREVGELAARCTSATEEIEQIVEKIQRETNDVVTAMELGTAQVVEGTRVLEEAKSSFGQVIYVSQQIDSLVQSISHATVSQVETSQAVTQLMQQIALVSKHTSASSSQVSEALKETVEISQELQATVETFRVS